MPKYHAINGKWIEVNDDPHRLASVSAAVHDAYSRHPVRSHPLGVAPHQVGMMRERIREAGASSGAKVDRKGHVYFDSRAAQKKLLRHIGWVNHDGGYGD